MIIRRAFADSIDIRARSLKLKAGRLLALALLSFATLGPGTGGAQEAEPLPSIEARIFPVEILRKSSSQRVYLLKSTDSTEPKVGRILLLKRDSEPVMAFRVLKLYPKKNEFAAKRVRKYGDHETLKAAESFTAIEKLRDMDVSPPMPTPQDDRDLKEIESPGAPPFDPELDAAGSPKPEKSALELEDESLGQNEEMDLQSLVVEESTPFDVNSHGASFEFGYFRNLAPDGSSTTFGGGGLRYSTTVSRSIFMNKAVPQDALALEFGAFLYKILNYASETQGDAYLVMPLTGTLRYSVLFSDNFGIFGYGGISKNLVLSATNVPSVSEGEAGPLDLLSSFQPAVGVGMSFRVGPNWETRVNLGVDMIGAGLVLRF